MKDIIKNFCDEILNSYDVDEVINIDINIRNGKEHWSVLVEKNFCAHGELIYKIKCSLHDEATAAFYSINKFKDKK